MILRSSPVAEVQDTEQSRTGYDVPLPVMQGPGHIFRYDFWRVAAKVTLGTVAASLLMTLVMSASFSSQIRVFISLSMLLFSLIYGLAVSGVVTLAYPVHISRDGIRGHNQWGTRHSVAWREVLGAKPVNILTFRYLRIWGDGSIWALWMPLFLKDMAAVRAAVLEFAPPGCPLRAFFDDSRP